MKLLLRCSLPFLTILISISSSISQLDSVSVVSDFVYVDGVDDLGDSIDIKIIETSILVNDFDFLGEAIVEVYELSSDYLVYMAKFSKQELIDQSMVDGNEFEIPGYNIEENRSYRIRVWVKDYLGNGMPSEEYILNFSN